VFLAALTLTPRRSTIVDSSRVVTEFGAEATAMQVIAGIDLAGQRAIVTGASSGIGVETSRALASANADVTLAVRDLAAGQRVAAEIAGTTGSRAIHVSLLDLADQESIAAFAAAWSGPLHLLVGNAGVMALPDRLLTSRGWEMHFAVNHLGHFALALGLHDALAAAGGARIVSVSSLGHLRSPVLFEDLNFSTHRYDPFVAYGQSKTANILFAVDATRHWAADAITVNAVHPGAIADTRISRHLDPQLIASLRSRDPSRFKSTEQGAATSVLVATSPRLNGIGGRYFEDCNEAEPISSDAADLSDYCNGVAGYALDPANAKHLWDLSQSLLA
jgi:NAD(P)-dependent dehydrogenase (short-subunit alcohol dehydrogenase family)